MNNQIFDFLNEYAKLPSPQYAVLLRGKWGCGKTYSRILFSKYTNNAAVPRC